jgi:hypothetical protein
VASLRITAPAATTMSSLMGTHGSRGRETLSTASPAPPPGSRLVTAHEHRQPTAGTDRGNEGRPIVREETKHPRQRSRENRAILRTREPLCCKNERCHAGALESLEFRSAVPDALILGDDSPSVDPGSLKPDRVGGILREMVSVNLNVGARGAQRLRDGVSAEVSVDEEDGIGALTRRRDGPFRSGSLRGSLAAIGRSRRLGPQPPRQRQSVPQCSA